MDIIAGICELIACWLVGNKNKYAFLFALFCNFLWIAYVFTNGTTYGLLIVCIPLAFRNIWNYRKWNNEEVSPVRK